MSNLQTSVNYWHKQLGMTVVDQSQTSATLCYDTNKCKLELVQVNGKVDHGTAFGRIAFSCPKSEQEGIQSSVKDSGNTILTPLVSLDTPGKATVTVVILADPVRINLISTFIHPLTSLTYSFVCSFTHSFIHVLINMHPHLCMAESYTVA